MYCQYVSWEKVCCVGNDVIILTIQTRTNHVLFFRIFFSSVFGWINRVWIINQNFTLSMGTFLNQFMPTNCFCKRDKEKREKKNWQEVKERFFQELYPFILYLKKRKKKIWASRHVTTGLDISRRHLDFGREMVKAAQWNELSAEKKTKSSFWLVEKFLWLWTFSQRIFLILNQVLV